MLPLHPRQMFPQRLLQRDRHHRDSILAALAVPDGQLTATEVNVLDTQFHTLEQPQPRSVHQRGHQPYRTSKPGEE